MGFHTFDPDEAARLEDAGQRYRYLSREELLADFPCSGSTVAADIGSGTGFYTDDVAPFVDVVYAVDVQGAMHDYYRAKGLPRNVTPVIAAAAALPLETDGLDVALSTMTFHEFVSDDAMTELARVVRPGGRLLVVDWSAAGEGAAGPPTDERYTADDAAGLVRPRGFSVDRAAERPETFRLLATRE